MQSIVPLSATAFIVARRRATGIGRSAGLSARIAAIVCPAPEVLVRMEDRVANVIADAVAELIEAGMSGPQARAAVHAHVTRPLGSSVHQAVSPARLAG